MRRNHLLRTRKMIIFILLSFRKHIKRCFLRPLPHLFKRRIVVIAAFMRMFTLNERESQLLAGDKRAAKVFLEGTLNGEIEMRFDLQCSMEMCQDKSPIFWKDTLHRINADKTIESACKVHFL